MNYNYDQMATIATVRRKRHLQEAEHKRLIARLPSGRPGWRVRLLVTVGNVLMTMGTNMTARYGTPVTQPARSIDG